MSRKLWFATAALLLAGCGGDGGGTTDPAGAGVIEGQVAGRGGGVPGAQVALEGGGTQTTNAEGKFTFSNVAAGTRSLTVTAPSGFVLDDGQPATKSVAVTAGGTASLEWRVKLVNTTPRTQEVTLGAVDFTPNDVVLPAGSTVKWVNGTAIAHTITPNNPNQPGAWPDQQISGSGTSFSHHFSSAGTYPYNCRFHAGMTGVVRVH